MRAIARQQGAYIFSDEVYRLLELDENNRLPAIADCYEKGLSLSVMSKAYGLPGLRVSKSVIFDYIFTNYEVRERWGTSPRKRQRAHKVKASTLALVGGSDMCIMKMLWSGQFPVSAPYHILVV